jgi:hypothetical protein
MAKIQDVRWQGLAPNSARPKAGIMKGKGKVAKAKSTSTLEVILDFDVCMLHNHVFVHWKILPLAATILLESSFTDLTRSLEVFTVPHLIHADSARTPQTARTVLGLS